MGGKKGDNVGRIRLRTKAFQRINSIAIKWHIYRTDMLKSLSYVRCAEVRSKNNNHHTEKEVLEIFVLLCERC